MKNLRNKVMLIGNLGRDPEVKSFGKGQKLARFSVATSETYKNAEGNKITDTQWHTVVAWGKLADIVEQYIQKGKEVIIEGKLTHRFYEDSNGTRRNVTEVVAHDILLTGSKAASI